MARSQEVDTKRREKHPKLKTASHESRARSAEKCTNENAGRRLENLTPRTKTLEGRNASGRKK